MRCLVCRAPGLAECLLGMVSSRVAGCILWRGRWLGLSALLRFWWGLLPADGTPAGGVRRSTSGSRAAVGNLEQLRDRLKQLGSDVSQLQAQPRQVGWGAAPVAGAARACQGRGQGAQARARGAARGGCGRARGWLCEGCSSCRGWQWSRCVTCLPWCVGVRPAGTQRWDADGGAAGAHAAAASGRRRRGVGVGGGTAQQRRQAGGGAGGGQVEIRHSVKSMRMPAQ